MIRSVLINGGSVLLPIDQGVELGIEGVENTFYKTTDSTEYGTVTSSISSDSFINKNYYPIKKEPITSIQRTTAELQSVLFKPQIDEGIVKILNKSVVLVPDVQDAVARVTDLTIRDALQDEVKNNLYKIKMPDGRLIPANTITQSIKSRILTRKVDQIDDGYIAKLAQITNPVQTSSIQTLTPSSIKYNPVVYLDNTFGRSRSDIQKQRQYDAQRLNNLGPVVTDLPNENRAIARAYEKKISLDYTKPETYSELKLWYILPEDIYTKVIIQSADGTPNYFYVNNNETFNIQTSAGTEYIPVTPYAYDVSVLTSNGVQFVPSEKDLDRAYTLNNSVEQACLYDVRSGYNTTFTVSSVAASNLEYTANLRVTRPQYYVLLLDKENIEELPSADFTRTTRVKYTLAFSNEEIQSAIQNKSFPWQVLPVNHDDPILCHFAGTSNYEIKYTNFSFHNFGDDSTLPIFPRKIPKAVLILLTDKFNYLFYNGMSYVENFNVRSLNYTLSPDPDLYNLNITQHYWLDFSARDSSTEQDPQIQSIPIAATLNTERAAFTDTYSTGTEPTRSEHGFRKMLRTIVQYKENYELDKGLAWTDVFQNMNVTQYINYKSGVSDNIINRVKNGENTGVRLFHSTGSPAGVAGNPSRLTAVKISGVEGITQIDQEPIVIIPDTRISPIS